MTALPPPVADSQLSGGWRSLPARAENLGLSVVLAAMMAMPLLEVLLRGLLHVELKGQASIVQHLTLIAGMMGAAIAAREGGLLSLSSVDLFIKGTWRLVARSVSAAVAAVVTALLCLASVRFVLSEREAGGTFAYGVPLWIVQVALPLGFALVTLRILWRASDKWKWRGAAIALAGLLALCAMSPPVPPPQLVIPAFALLLLATVLGAPIFAALGGAGLILFWHDGSPIASLTVDHYGLVTNPTLPTVPLFTLAGYFLAEGGASRRLIRLFRALVGQLRGGPAILVALVCAFFTSFTGASGVTILALGALLMPVLLAAGYSQRTALGLLTGTGSLGLLLPPCLPLIFYGVIAGVDIKDMFLGGIIPGILLIVLTAIWGISQAPRGAGALQRFDWRETRLAVWDAKWELLIPVVALGALFSGLATPVQAAALTAFYAFVVETFVYQDLRPFGDSPRVMAESGVLVGGVLLILGVALGFTNYLAFAEIPARAVDWVTATVHSKWAFLLLLNLFLIVVGALMDIYSAIVIVVPLLVPLGRAFGIDPIHLGIVFLANLGLGSLTPPVGVNLFLASLRFNQPMSAVVRSVIPMLIVLLIGVLLITYIPAMTTTLPRWFGR
ncbi:MAG: TRAP transporter large permease subunit [Gemmatimonadetes bacterium]|nr:TRAP transporter large permease subunit [Gemmatimonadota bacterium]